MITIEQLKDVKERTAALERYLDIENKLVQVEEEQLRTQAPGFWDECQESRSTNEEGERSAKMDRRLP